MSGRTALYRVYGDGGLLLYIGISKDFGKRWKNEARDFPWWGEHRRMTVDWHDSRPQAAAAETAAIAAEDPRYNIRRPPVRAVTLPRPIVPPRPRPAAGPPPSMLTYREAAAKIGVSLSGVYRLLRAGEIHSVEMAPQVKRIPMSECYAYVNRLVAEQIGEAS